MKKETRGRKPKPESEKITVLYVYVKKKHVKEVKPKVKEIEREYNSK